MGSYPRRRRWGAQARQHLLRPVAVVDCVEVVGGQELAASANFKKGYQSQQAVEVKALPLLALHTYAVGHDVIIHGW